MKKNLLRLRPLLVLLFGSLRAAESELIAGVRAAAAAQKEFWSAALVRLAKAVG
ncbi:MAG: hypothetical protein HY736_02890 [Verrucomicrobia bacterium]|nr:hypothetical protein [Verrucomicrobiota bacterium]